jgi:Protein of unknown function (DUF2442)
MNPEAVAVVVQADYCLLVTFKTGERKRFDAKPYLQYPAFQKLTKPGYFEKAHVEYGTVVWDENTDLSPDALFLEGVDELPEMEIA